ncbi:hypothetical protein BOX15_Mlig005442g3 [Macrostomum lignano]|uniref:Calpain catalytic domain-containing protein n=1 Tax=Macrostomum lignano TaxID=282301 RepID=A0A267G7R7_9PLAT|nr:hypothetical protein BOX15_Mlig005442g3 [Macrostomum lignano]
MTDMEDELEELLQKHENILTMCCSRQSMYEDPEFPANDRAIKHTGSTGRYGIKWLRPKQINPNATFIKDGFSRSDISQGGLGDCWILAAMAGMAERPEIINRVVPEGQSMEAPNYCGAFRFRFRKFGKEVEILVDDRLPTEGGRTIYTEPLNGEFWVCLLEKALAKFYGCYEALEGGVIFEALADLTGGVCEDIKLKDWKESQHPKLARHIERCLNRKGSVIGASSIPSHNGDDYEMGNGLVYSHAYTITGLKVIQVKTGSAMGKWRDLELIRVRNPWGSTEWGGDWSDNYRGWSEEQKRAVQLVSRDDGEFWMSFADFAKFFRAVTILHFGSPAESSFGGDGGLGGRGATEWRCHGFYGEWKKGVSAGGQPYYRDSHFTNPQFVVELVDSPDDEDDTAACLVSLEEPDQRILQAGRRDYAAKAVFLYSLAPGQTHVAAPAGGRRLAPAADSCPFTQSRTHVFRFQMKPGRYAVMPCTFEPGEETEFLLRVFTEA